MPPDKRFVALFDLSHHRVKMVLSMTCNVHVNLQDSRRRDQELLEYVFDLNFRYGIRRIESKTIHDVAKSLKEIERNIERWTHHSNELRVWFSDGVSYLAHEDEQ
jgi:hypothetical protein